MAEVSKALAYNNTLLSIEYSCKHSLCLPSRGASIQAPTKSRPAILHRVLRRQLHRTTPILNHKSTQLLTHPPQGIIIWACLDPANPFVSPQSAPFAIGLAYAVMVWGFADVTISTNLARDLGTRLVAAIFYGPEVFSYLNYSWISILVNVPATLFATGYYEFLMRDSLQKISKGAAVHEGGEEGLALHLTKSGINMDGAGLMEKGMTNVTGYGGPDVEHKEVV